MPILEVNEIKKKYLLALKNACRDLNASVCHRESIRDSNRKAIGIKELAPHFIDGEIEKKFNELKENLSENKKNSITYCNLFDSFIFEKTGCTIDTTRILAAFTEKSTVKDISLEKMIALEAVCFEAGSVLRSDFSLYIQEAIQFDSSG
ncbi:hypothetical protein [Piscirickettsia salmonis]|uniref:hypothetical protein n=1 Tax=Piscirickettsia salmonis TaxID=1238 RepID=UPI003A80B72A